MAFTDKLRDLDQRLLPGTRNDGEDAETYLRRVAASRAISPAQAGDVMAALRVYFGIETADGGGRADEVEGGSSGQKDEAEEAGSEEQEDSAEESDDDK